MIEETDTIAAIATPAGNGGIGIIRVSGPAVKNIAFSVTGKKPNHKEVVYSSFNGLDGELIDKGFLLYFHGPASYTGEDVLELHAHGGRAVLQLLLKTILNSGAREAGPGEFTERAFLNNKLDLLQAEAVADLIESSSEQAVRSAQRSLQGLFSESVNGIVEKLIQARVLVEGALDFADEDINIELDAINRILHECQEGLEEVSSKARQGRVLREGLELVVAGPPNAGKSSLLNALAKSNRAIVTSTPGTTRDTVEEMVVLNGVRINVVDTAGIRETTNEIEAEGMRRSKEAMEKADLVIWLEDVQDHESLVPVEAAGPGRNLMRVKNKVDLLEGLPKHDATEDGFIYVSAKEGRGLVELEGRIMEKIGLENIADDVFSARDRHLNSLREASVCLCSCIDKIKTKNLSLELVAEELREAQQFLEKITGKITADDILGEIFASFCIGK